MKEERGKGETEKEKERKEGRRRKGGREGGRAEDRQVGIYLGGKSGFSMETKVPVCLKMALKRKIVNHFPPRRQA